MRSCNLNFKRLNKSKKEELDRLIKKLNMGLDHSWSAPMTNASTNVSMGHIGSGSFSEPVRILPNPAHDNCRSKTRYFVGGSINRVEFYQPGPIQSHTHLKGENMVRVVRHSGFGFGYQCELFEGRSELRWGGKHSDRLAGGF
jgi:hypothetical protein